MARGYYERPWSRILISDVILLLSADCVDGAFLCLGGNIKLNGNPGESGDRSELGRVNLILKRLFRDEKLKGISLTFN